MKSYSCLVSGDAGGGKTTLMREMFDTFGKEHGLSIWVNHNREQVPGTTVTSLEELRATNDTRLDLHCSDALEGARIARRAGRAYHEATGYPFQIVVDEAQDRALPDGSSVPDTPVKRGLHRDRDHGGKWVVATQDPSDLHYTPLKQIRYWIWCGSWSVFHSGFLDYWNIPRSELPDEPYHYVAFDKQMTVVERGTTNPDYAR